MTATLFDTDQIETQIEKLTRELANPRLSQCQRVSKIFLLRELQTELQHLHQDSAIPAHATTDAAP